MTTEQGHLLEELMAPVEDIKGRQQTSPLPPERNLGSISKYVIFMMSVGCRPEAPVAEREPVGFSDGGNRRDWFPGVRGPRAASYAK